MVTSPVTMPGVWSVCHSHVQPYPCPGVQTAMLCEERCIGPKKEEQQKIY